MKFTPDCLPIGNGTIAAEYFNNTVSMAGPINNASEYGYTTINVSTTHMIDGANYTTALNQTNQESEIIKNQLDSGVTDTTTSITASTAPTTPSPLARMRKASCIKGPNNVGEWSMTHEMPDKCWSKLSSFLYMKEVDKFPLFQGINCTQPPHRADVTTDWDSTTYLFEHKIM